MDLSTATRNPSNAGRSPRLQTQLSSDQTPSDNKKSPVISPGADSTGTKAFGFLVKTSSTPAPAKESGSVVIGTSPKMLKNITDKSPLQESTKKANRTSLVNKSRDAALPHLNDDKSKITGSFVDDNQRDLEIVDKLASLSNVRDNSPDAENHQKFPGRKLPTIINKKVLQKSDQKKSPMKKTSTERNASVLGLGKGEIDMIISPKSPNQQRITIQLSNSPVMKSPIVDRKSSNKTVGGAEDEVIMVGTRKLYAEDKNRPSLNIENLRAKYVSPPGKTVHTNVSGGEEEDDRKGGSPLMISPMRGAQRAAKPAMKKIELSRHRRVGSPESKERSVEVIDLRKLSKKKPETSKVESHKKVSKKKEESNSASYREIAGKVPKEEKVEKAEKAEKKKKAAQADDEMDGWGKSEDSESKDLGDEEEEEENKEENKETQEGTSPRRDEKQVEVEKEKPKDQVKEEKEKEKTKEKVGNSSAKKPGVASPRMNREAKTNKKVLEANLGIITAGKDPMQVKREQAYKEFMQKLNFSFNVQVKIPTEKTFTSYKYFLGKGNNSIMIKAMMKQRWWWTHVDNKDAADINFIWTQLKQNSFIGGLKQKRKSPFDNLEWSGVSSHAGDTTANTTTTIDSITDCESDNTDGETKVVVKKSKKSSQAKTGKGGKMKRSSTVAVDDKSLQDIAASSMKKLFTDNEIMLMNSVSGNKGNGVIYPEDYEELGKTRKGPSLHVISDPSNMKMCNHLENNFHLANKKALLWNMKSYYEAIKQNVFDYLPLTFHVRNGFDDKEYHRFIEYYSAREKEIQEQEEAKDGKKAGKKLKNIWIVKPGENTNRGVGINVCDSLSQINELVATTEGKTDSKKRTYLIQQYLDKPLLYNKRKFDIRCYILMTCINGMMKGYWYQDGYIRTASKEFSLKNVTNKFVHLTNDAVQKKAEDYGKFESGNKLSYNDFQKYLDAHHEGNVNFNNDIYPQIKQLATDTIKGVYGKIDPYRRENCFEVFGLDFMIDANLKAWLIEVNTNPDINASSPVLTRVIPPMVENALRLTIDQMYPPPTWAMNKKQMLPENLLENNKFELVFDEVEDGPALRSILQPEKGATGDLILEIVAEEAEEDGEEEVKE